MAIEKKWPAVAPQLFTSDGTSTGLVTVANTRGFKVKATAAITCPGQPNLPVLVCRVLSDTQMIVTKMGGKITDRNLNLTSYTVSAGAYIFAEEQPKTELTQQDREMAVYDQEPAVAYRNVLVDQLGRYYETSNPLPVRLSDGSINIGTVNAEINVALSSKTGTKAPDSPADSVRIGDQNAEVAVQPDGPAGQGSLQTVKRNTLVKVPYDEISISYDPDTQDMSGATYKLNGQAVATLTMQYDEFGNMTNVKVT